MSNENSGEGISSIKFSKISFINQTQELGRGRTAEVNQADTDLGSCMCAEGAGISWRELPDSWKDHARLQNMM